MDVAAGPLVRELGSCSTLTLEELYRRDHAAVVGLAYVLSGSRTAAEELAQEAFLAAYRRWDRVSGFEDPGAWVRGVAANRAVSLVRRRAAEVRALTRLAGQRLPPLEALPADDDTYWRAVRELPRRQAQAIALRYLEDRSTDDIAAVLGCSEGTVRVHLHRGRRALADRLDLEEQ